MPRTPIDSHCASSNHLCSCPAQCLARHHARVPFPLERSLPSSQEGPQGVQGLLEGGNGPEAGDPQAAHGRVLHEARVLGLGGPDDIVLHRAHAGTRDLGIALALADA